MPGYQDHHPDPKFPVPHPISPLQYYDIQKETGNRKEKKKKGEERGGVYIRISQNVSSTGR
jgi:hypothetical protein